MEQSHLEGFPTTANPKPWSNMAHVVYKRTYSRKDGGRPERWDDTVERVISGNVRGHNVSDAEITQLRRLLTERKAGPAGRGWWFSGSPAHERLGGVALNNCWATTSEDWHNYVFAQDLLMLGGGVGISVEHRFTSKLPRVKRGVKVIHKATRDADFIVPDSREGWNELTYRVLEAFFVTGKSFSYSTVCVRGMGEPIHGFGGIAAGPKPLVEFVEKLCGLLVAREGRAVRPIDAADILCAIGEMVVSGNVRRSAIIVLGDPWDKDYLKCKRWDLGLLPSYRGCANWSVVCDDVEDLHPLFWKSYEHGEPIGIVNRTNIQKYGRMGELKKDSAYLCNPCAEATLEDGEPCNLQNIALHNLDSEAEFMLAARLMHRWGKRVTCETFHHEKANNVVHKNRRIGTSITGCLRTPSLFSPEVLDEAYGIIQEENRTYSKELGIPESTRTTTLNPGGTITKVYDGDGYEGVHAAISRFIIQRIRFAANDPLIPRLLDAGHRMEPVIKLDGSLDHNTLVVDFYQEVPEGLPTDDGGWDTWKQLDAALMAQKHWADQSVSVTVYYKKSEIPLLKQWLADHIGELKTISFLAASEHGFLQAPKEAISEAEYRRLSSKISPIVMDAIEEDGDFEVTGAECIAGMCPSR